MADETRIQQMQELLQRALIKIRKLEQQLQEPTATPTLTGDERVAIVGTGCRFPQGITTAEQLWQLVRDKKHAVSKVPADRFDIDRIYDPDGLTPGKTNSPYGTFLTHDVKVFDADFFGISPREAKSIDPVQRLMLEVIYEAFEQAGIATQPLQGKNVGVYVAIGNNDYVQARLRSGRLEDADVYDITGVPFATFCGRISYLYDFQGESISVDTACSSVLVCIQQAQQALNQKEIDLAVVVSANLILTPEYYVSLSKLGSLSPSGSCKAFADDGDGYIRGEGVGAIILKRYEDARRDRDNIDALVRGSVTRHNGTSNGFTAPNSQVQRRIIREVLEKTRTEADAVDYVEAHGVGNKFTDALEIQAIHEGYAGKQLPVYVGSVKPNIGNLEGATGMAMLFKVIGALKHHTIPANINIKALNTDVSWDSVNVRVPVENLPWDKPAGKPRLAAINLSGYSGTNVHMILEEASAAIASEPVSGVHLFNLSARSRESLVGLAKKYLSDPGIFERYTLAEICYTLSCRNTWDYKLSVLAENSADVLQALQDLVSGNKNDKLLISDPELIRSREIAFLFTGQGAQYFGMCREYYEQFDVFRQVVDSCDAILQPYLKTSIKDILWADDSKAALLHQTQYTQPALFVVEYALAQLWMSEGIQPAALAGHSIGELIALTLADALTLEEALKVVVARAALMQSVPAGTGAMASCFCSEQEIAALLPGSNVDIAAVNSPRNITVAGLKEDVAALVEKLKAAKIRAVPLQVSHAFHSHTMEPILGQFRQFLATVNFREPQLPVISNITGKELTLEEWNADYLVRHIRSTVQFSKSMATLKADHHIDIYLECGPAPVLVSLARQTNTDPQAVWLHAAKKDSSDVLSFLRVKQELFVSGIRIDWSSYYAGKTLHRVVLPTYAWQWKTYWYNPVKQGAEPATDAARPPAKPLAKAAVQEPGLTRDTLLAVMQIEAARVLDLEAGQRLDIQKTYREQGFDSMMSAEFLSRLEKKLHTELKMAVLHEHPTPKELHQYLIDTYFGGGLVDTTQAVTMADLMFSSELENRQHQGDWHEIKPGDGVLMRWFKQFDKKIPALKD